MLRIRKLIFTFVASPEITKKLFMLSFRNFFRPEEFKYITEFLIVVEFCANYAELHISFNQRICTNKKRDYAKQNQLEVAVIHAKL